MIPTDIIAIRAGLAGLAVSIGMAELGFHFQVVEQHADRMQQEAALGLVPSGQKALHKLALAAFKQLQDQGNPM